MTDMPKCPFCGEQTKRVYGNYAYPACQCLGCNEIMDLIAVGIYWIQNNEPGNIVGFKDKENEEQFTECSFENHKEKEQ